MDKRPYVMILAFVFVFGALSLNPVQAADGQQLFTSMGCAACHKPDQKTVGFALKDIAASYQSEDKLARFFTDGNPTIKPTINPVMAPFLEKIKKLPDADKKALAQYIMNPK